MSERLAIVLAHAALGFRIFPVHTPEDGGCSCARPTCKHVGKHPRIKNWLSQATSDPEQIRRWWTRWPDANIGVATGRGSGIIVVDIDPRSGGDDALADLVREHGPLPETWEALTGGGGRHLLFQHPGFAVPNGTLRRGVDVRGDGGLIVAPGSIHASGRSYEWELSSQPGEIALAPAPEWLLERLRRPERSTAVPEPRRPGGGACLPLPVLSGCAWLQHCVTDAATLGYHEWHSMLAILAHCAGGEQLAHEWSKAHPKYTPEETAEHLRYARASERPRTCAYIRDQLGGEPYCNSCVHWGRIKSPMALAARLGAIEPPPDYVRSSAGFLEEPALPLDTGERRFFSGPGQGPGAAARRESDGAAKDGGEVTDPAGTEGEIPAAARMTLEDARTTAKRVTLTARDDHGVVFEAEVLHALALLRKYDAQMWARAKQELRKARLTLGDVVRELPEVELHPGDRAAYGRGGEDEDDGAKAARLAGDMLAECPLPTLRIPDGFGLRWNAVTRTVRDQEGAETEHTLAYAPIVVIGRLRDTVLGEESLLVAWRWPGSPWATRIVARAQLLSARGLVSLASWGFPVGDDTAKGVVSYLHRLEALNRRHLPCAAVSSHLGWQGENGEDGFLCGRALVRPDGEIEDASTLDTERPETWSEKKISFHGLSEGDAQIVEAFQTRGTLEGWIETVALAAPYPKAILALYVALAAPLLQILQCPNFVADWSNSTTTGKSTALRIGASAYGNPDERAADSVVQTWDASRVWTERASAVLQSLPLCLDDTKRARHPRQVSDLIYTVANGRGRGRGTINGLARTVSWRTILMSTGEAPATSFTQDGGVRTRVLSIRGLPFGGQTDETRRLVERITAGLLAHHGHAARHFLRWLLTQREAWDEWREYSRQVTEHFATSGGCPEAGRLAQYAATVHVAGLMLHRALELPWEYADPIRILWPALVAEAAEASGELRALQHVVSWAYSREATFHGRLPSDRMGGERPVAASSGRWDQDLDGRPWEWIGIFPSVLNETLRAEGFEAEAILSGWRERGWLACDAGKYTKPQRLGDGRPRLVCLLREAVEAAG